MIGWVFRKFLFLLAEQVIHSDTSDVNHPPRALTSTVLRGRVSRASAVACSLPLHLCSQSAPAVFSVAGPSGGVLAACCKVWVRPAPPVQLSPHMVSLQLGSDA